MSTSGDIMSTSEDVQYIGRISWWMWGYHEYIGGMFSTSEGYHEYIGGYHEYIGGCSVHRRDIMIHVGEQLDKILSISIENSDVLNIPRCTHDIPPMYSWYPPMYSWYPPMYWTSPDVIMVSPDVLMVSLQSTEHPPMYSWYPSDVLNTPRCTHDIPPMYSWYPPDVLMVSPWCTEHPPMYWTHIIQGGFYSQTSSGRWNFFARLWYIFFLDSCFFPYTKKLLKVSYHSVEEIQHESTTLTQENCFLFCKKYGLFKGFIFLTIKKFLRFYFPNIHGQRWKGDKILVFHTWSRVVSAMERVHSKNLYTNSFTRNELWNFRLKVLKTSALIYGFLLYLNPVKAQSYRITHVHNYHSIRSTTILWKIFYLILFEHIKSDFVSILSASASRVNWDIDSQWNGARYWIGQSAWLVYMSYLLSPRAWNYHVINSCDLLIQLVWELERSLHKSISWWLRQAQVFSDEILYKNFAVI